jgi:hypothetical protein
MRGGRPPRRSIVSCRSLVSESCPIVPPQLYRRPTALGYREEVELRGTGAGIGAGREDDRLVFFNPFLTYRWQWWVILLDENVL